MKKTFLTAVSAFALMVTIPAYAETAGKETVTTGASADAQVEVEANNEATPAVETVSEEQIEQGWENTKEAVADAAEETGEAIENTYYDLRAVFDGNKNADAESQVTIKNATTAESIFGRKVFNAEGETVATVADVVVDQNGEARLLILRDGGFFGFGGKLVALDYDRMVSQNDTGVTINTASQDMLNKVEGFTYDPRSNAKNVRVLSAEAISVSEMIGSPILDNSNESTAEIENVTFANGKIDYLVVAFNQTLALGGDTAAMQFSDLQIERENGEPRFKLSAEQSAKFSAYKERVESRS